MKILAISDLFVPATVMREALAPLHPDQLHVVEWLNRNRTELHQRIRQIEQHGPGAVPPPDQAWPLATEADLIVTHLCPLSSELLQHAKELKMIGVCRGGTDTIACDKAQERGIPILSVPGRNAVAVAEFTIGLILAAERGGKNFTTSIKRPNSQVKRSASSVSVPLVSWSLNDSQRSTSRSLSMIRSPLPQPSSSWEENWSHSTFYWDALTY